MFRLIRRLTASFVFACVILPFFFVCTNILIGVKDQPAPAPVSSKTINDITGMNPIAVEHVITVTSVEQVQDLVRAHPGPISIGGGRYSMGGQIGVENSLHLDMRSLNKILSIDREKKQVTVQAGATWHDIQRELDSQDLSLKIMQSYGNFTVGGSISVNVHGRYIGYGPLISTVHSLKIVVASGELVTADRATNPELFFGAIGGYGGLGVIVEATLDLADNTSIERVVEAVAAADYGRYFAEKVRDNREIVFQNGDLIPDEYDTVYSVVWKTTGKALTEQRRLNTDRSLSWTDKTLKFLFMEVPYAIKLRKHLEPYRYRGDAVVRRNFEASYDVASLGAYSGKHWSYALEEYFIPVERFSDFTAALKRVLNAHGVEELNVSVRHALPDEGSLLSWARQEVFAFVLFYRQKTDKASRHKVTVWTRELIDEALKLGGSYYLPYQIHATNEQFHAAFPRATELFALKDKLDPTYKFRNRLFDTYYRPTPEVRVEQSVAAIPGYYRPEDQTYLTLPEWELVYASEALASAVERGSQSSFSFLGAIKRFWSVDRAVIRETAPKYPINGGYHFMNAVIGVHTTVEYLLKGIYENTIGRVSEAVGGANSNADRFIQKTYRDYANYIHHTPWYRFPFASRLRQVWHLKQDPADSTFRHYERRIAFGFELGVKAALGKLFGVGTKSLYGAEEERIGAVITGDVAGASQLVPEMKIVEQQGGGISVVTFPRYEKFTRALKTLASSSAAVSLQEVAGNKTIVISYLARKGQEIPAVASGHLIRYPLLGEPERERVAAAIPVGDLLSSMQKIEAAGAEVEHVYDY